MVKKIGVFITILGLVFIGLPQFSKEVKAIDFTSRTYYGSYNYIPNQGVNDLGETTYRVTFSYLDVNTDDPLWGNSIQLAMQNYSNNYGSRDAVFSGGSSFYWFFYPNNLNPVNSAEYVPLGNFDVMRIVSNGIILYRNGNIYKSWTLTELKSLIGENFTLHNITRNTEYDAGFDDGYNLGETNGYTSGYQQGLDVGFDDGYSQGINETDATGFNALLTTVFGGLGGLLAIEILPNIHIGAIIAVPLVFGIIAFILGKRKGD